MDKKTVVFKSNGKCKVKEVGGFSDDPAHDLSNYSRSEIEAMLGADKNSPILVVVK